MGLRGQVWFWGGMLKIDLGRHVKDRLENLKKAQARNPGLGSLGSFSWSEPSQKCQWDGFLVRKRIIVRYRLFPATFAESPAVNSLNQFTIAFPFSLPLSHSLQLTVPTSAHPMTKWILASLALHLQQLAVLTVSSVDSRPIASSNYICRRRREVFTLPHVFRTESARTDWTPHGLWAVRTDFFIPFYLCKCAWSPHGVRVNLLGLRAVHTDSPSSNPLARTRTEISPSLDRPYFIIVIKNATCKDWTPGSTNALCN